MSALETQQVKFVSGEGLGKPNEVDNVIQELQFIGEQLRLANVIEKRRKTPCFSYGDIRRTVYTHWQLV